jgi:hypothetical protein
MEGASEFAVRQQTPVKGPAVGMQLDFKDAVGSAHLNSLIFVGVVF